MAYAGARFALNLVRALQGETGIVECSYVAVENMDVAYFGVPVEFGKEGVAKIHPLPKLNNIEQARFNELIPILKGNIETGEKFGRE
jgi:malate/lactate dehydrogenase